MWSRKFQEIYINEYLVMFVILLNSLVLFLDAFPDLQNNYGNFFFIVDYACTFFFVFELIFKIHLLGWKNYWSSNWNKFDFIVVILSIPLLLSPILNTREFGVLLILRVGRILRFFRLARFIPNQDKLLRGIKRAIAASVGFIITLSIYNFILAIGAAYLFADIAPEHFGDPIISIYSMFRVFTIEGWYEIPEIIARNSNPLMAFVARLYFVFTVLTGGIIGLSIANAVFVDEMIMDNTDTLEDKIDTLRDEIKKEFETIRENNRSDLTELQRQMKEILLKKEDS